MKSSVMERENASLNRFQHQLVTACLDSLPTESVEWLWPQKIPRGQVTLFSGDPEIGKSFVTLDIAARVSSGKAWPVIAAAPKMSEIMQPESKQQPVEEENKKKKGSKKKDAIKKDAVKEDGETRRENKAATVGRANDDKKTDECSTANADESESELAAASTRSIQSPVVDEPAKQETAVGSVLLLNSEDSAASTIRPRLEQMGADLRKIRVLMAVQTNHGERSFSLAQDIQALERAANEMGDCKLIVIDPLTSYLGGIGSGNTNLIRAVLDPLKKLAERTGAAVILVNHLSKQKQAALYRSIGSIAIVGLARIAWAFAQSTRDDGQRVMMPLKNNLVNRVQGAAYRIVDGAVVWDEEAVTDNADDVFDYGKELARQSALERAKEWLCEELEDGDIHHRDLVYEYAAKAGITEATLRRAKEILGVKSKNLGKDDGWYWHLPDHCA